MIKKSVLSWTAMRRAKADDPFAIAHALLCDKFIVKAIFAEHFNCEGSMKQSFEEIQRSR